MRLSLSLFLFLLFPVLAAADPLDLKAAGRHHVKEVVDGDTVVLDNGEQVRLVGIQAPKLPLGRRNFAKWPLADESKAALEKLALDQDVTLRQGGTPRDRHGRILAHLVRDDGLWIQGEMLTLGMARVYSFPDNRALVSEMLTREIKARQDARGIWSHPYYEIRHHDQAKEFIGKFELVQGRVASVGNPGNRIFLNFTNDWRHDFTISIDSQAQRLFRKTGLDPDSLRGREIRVRGWLKERNGPMIDVTHPEQIELIK